MRQGNQNNNNKRMRGRNRSGKGPNPLTRSYESNGPDVKIRGTALHIAEKYGQLARDAQSSGDRIVAESYFQHAEHYYRIIAAAQAQMPFPQQQVFRNGDEADEEIDEFGNPLPQQPNPQQQPQGQTGQQPGYSADGQSSFGGNGHTGPTPGSGDQPMVGDADGESEDDDGMDAAPSNGGNDGQPQGQGHGQGQFRRRRRQHRGGGGSSGGGSGGGGGGGGSGGGGGGRDYRDGNNFNPGQPGGGGPEE